MNTLNFSYFPAAPVGASTTLLPLQSWYDVVLEARCTGIEFDDFWLDSVVARVAYFFSWRGAVRATVLVVWSAGQVRHVECRTLGDHLLAEEDAVLVETEVHRLFTLARLKPQRVPH